MARFVIVLALAAALFALACSSTPDDAAAPGPTYAADVAPLLDQHCTSCHSPGRIAPFSLLTFEDARARADAIKRATASRTMPPYAVDNGGDCNTYKAARWLSAAEIATFAAWADRGAPEGTPTSSRQPPPEQQLAESTHELDIGTPYVPRVDKPDDYRCFVVDAGVSDDAFLTAYQVMPGDARVVHHVILYGLTDADAEKRALDLDAAEEGAGYTCFGGPGVGGGFGFLAAWAPGTNVTRYPEGTGLSVRGGRKSVLQIHYNTGAGARPDRTRIRLKIEPKVAKEAFVLPLANLDLDLPPRSGDVTQSAETTVKPGPTYHLLGVFPHMHTMGKSLVVERTRGTEKSCVTRVPKWSFHWQEFFFYERAIDFLPGDLARISCTYDTSAATERVKWGEGTADEMCLAGFYFTKD
jgi:hypothetical protein